jgi:hypothetical protein
MTQAMKVTRALRVGKRRRLVIEETLTLLMSDTCGHLPPRWLPTPVATTPDYTSRQGRIGATGGVRNAKTPGFPGVLFL